MVGAGRILQEWVEAQAFLVHLNQYLVLLAQAQVLPAVLEILHPDLILALVVAVQERELVQAIPRQREEQVHKVFLIKNKIHLAIV
jgi:hypothetical protein